ncbi:MAG: CPBP family intramembrane metalloprotease [Spirochaetales bacterium]|nr:CPBP family intramembrane metalloprotease [Spirochaetales bacterium]
MVEYCSLTIFMGVFGLFIHSPFPYRIISICGIISVCIMIAYRLFRNSHRPLPFLLAFFGIKPFTGKVPAYTALATPTTQNKKSRKYSITCNSITSRKVPANASVTGRKSWNNTRIFAYSNTVLCLLSGLIMGASLRVWNKAPLIPGTITLFAVGIAPLIGISEELLFRGYIQNRLYKINGLWAVFLAALSHTIYKCSLMVFPSLFDCTAIPYFAFWTFAGGFLFGILSWKSDTVFPALAGHAVFDIIVYSTYKTAPWWVW